jgi:hypothetical protein
MCPNKFSVLNCPLRCTGACFTIYCLSEFLDFMCLLNESQLSIYQIPYWETKRELIFVVIKFSDSGKSWLWCPILTFWTSNLMYTSIAGNIENMTREKSGSKLCDTDWHTQTSVLGHCTLGAWSNLDKGEDINCVSRSTFRDLLGVGENRGVIKLYKYPSSVHKVRRGRLLYCTESWVL